jgi:hypothetical protein
MRAQSTVAVVCFRVCTQAGVGDKLRLFLLHPFKMFAVQNLVSLDRSDTRSVRLLPIVYRWSPEMIDKLANAQKRAMSADAATTGRLCTHLLPHAGHWVHVRVPTSMILI